MSISRKRQPKGDTIGVTTRKMSRKMDSCVCRTPTLFIGGVAFVRSENDKNLIENAMWDIEKLGNLGPPCFKNLDQLLVELWKELPVAVSLEDELKWDFSQASDDSEEVRDYYYKEMFWCNNPDCGEIISWDPSVSICIYCGLQNDISECEKFSSEPDGKFLRLFPEQFKPFLSCLRGWFEELPTLKMVGIELGLSTYHFGAKVRRQLKVFPRVFHQDCEERFGILNSGQSNKCLPVPDEIRYEGLQSEEWYSNLFESKYKKNHVTFTDQNYLLGEESVFYKNRSSAWI